MSNNRMLALVAILAGGLMVGACGESITGPGLEGPGADPVPEVTQGPDGVTPIPAEALVNDPKGSDHGDAYDEEVER